MQQPQTDRLKFTFTPMFKAYVLWEIFSYFGLISTALIIGIHYRPLLNYLMAMTLSLGWLPGGLIIDTYCRWRYPHMTIPQYIRYQNWVVTKKQLFFQHPNIYDIAIIGHEIEVLAPIDKAPTKAQLDNVKPYFDKIIECANRHTNQYYYVNLFSNQYQHIAVLRMQPIVHQKIQQPN